MMIVVYALAAYGAWCLGLLAVGLLVTRAGDWLKRWRP